MKPGSRALGVAVSRETVGGAVVRRDRVTDGFAFTDCTVGGTDATAAITDLLSTLDREDVRWVTVAGIAPAWFNVIDLEAVQATAGVPVVAVSFEDSPGLEAAIRREFDDDDAAAERLRVYRSLPARHETTINGRSVWLRAVGCDVTRAAELVGSFTPADQHRPEPLRVARLAARAADRER